jgi:hypothetical protein
LLSPPSPTSAAAQLGYGPNRLGLVSEDIASTAHAGRIILRADDAARARGYTLLVINTSASASTASRQADVETQDPARRPPAVGPVLLQRSGGDGRLGCGTAD